MTGIATASGKNEIPYFEPYLNGEEVEVPNEKYKLQKPIINKETWNNYKIYTIGYGNIVNEDGLFKYANNQSIKEIYGGDIIYPGDYITLSIDNNNKLQFTGKVGNSKCTLSSDKIELKKMEDDYTFIEYSLMNMTITNNDWKISLKDISGIKTTAITAKEENKIIKRENLADNQTWGYIDLDSLITAIKSKDSKKEITDEDLNGANITIHWQKPAMYDTLYTIDGKSKRANDYSMYYILMKYILPQNGGYYSAVKRKALDTPTSELDSFIENVETIFNNIYDAASSSSSQEITMSALQNGISIRVTEGKNIEIEVIFANNETFTTEVENIQEGDDLIKKANGELYIDLDALAKKAHKSDSLSLIGATINITYK